jgi:hypothetical protein
VSTRSEFIGAPVKNTAHGWLSSHTSCHEQVSARLQQVFFNKG